MSRAVEARAPVPVNVVGVLSMLGQRLVAVHVRVHPRLRRRPLPRPGLRWCEGSPCSVVVGPDGGAGLVDHSQALVLDADALRRAGGSGGVKMCDRWSAPPVVRPVQHFVKCNTRTLRYPVGQTGCCRTV